MAKNKKLVIVEDQEGENFKSNFQQVFLKLAPKKLLIVIPTLAIGIIIAIILLLVLYL